MLFNHQNNVVYGGEVYSPFSPVQAFDPFPLSPPFVLMKMKDTIKHIYFWLKNCDLNGNKTLFLLCGVAVSLSILLAEFDTESSPTGYGWILKQWIEVGDPLVTSIIMRPIGLNVRNEGARTNWSHLAQVKIHKRRAENESNFANCILRRIQLLKSHERCRAASQSESCPSTAAARFFSHAADERGNGE